MAANQVFQIINGPISAHAFNADRTQLAISPNTNEIQIYHKNGQEWKLEHTLTEHDKLVTSLDWAPKSNRIVSCSQDRNAYVWTFDGEWKPTLVLLRINRAATYVRWSPLENKFAVASGARCISICYFEKDNDWWVSKHIKKPIRSTVFTVDWHPNNVLLAAGAADMRARVFSAWIKGVDEKPPSSPWGDKLPFNTICADHSNGNGGWVKDVAFSPDGDAVAWIAQDSSLSVNYPGKGPVIKLRTGHLPFSALVWTSPNSIVAAGHGCIPVKFSGDANGHWEEVQSAFSQSSKKSDAGGGITAKNIFMQMDSRAQTASSAGSDNVLESVHQNTINTLRVYQGSRDAVTMLSSTGVDGKLVIWHLR